MTATTTAEPGQFLAAIDLGSNSFQLLIAHWKNSQLLPVTQQKHLVQLARNNKPTPKGADNSIDSKAFDRGLSALEKFSHELASYPNIIVKCAGTQALRQAANGNQFLEAGQRLLGHSIEIISPQREAYLGFRGIWYFQQPPVDEPTQKKPIRLLAIDMGGASTEFSLGHTHTPEHWQSINLGCVSLANQFFDPSQKQFNASQFKQAYQFSVSKLRAIKPEFEPQHWQLAAGASGALAIILELLPECGQTIHKQQLAEYIQRTLTAGQLPDNLPSVLRNDVLPAGLALLAAIMDELAIDNIQVSEGSLKHGLLLEAIDLQ